jgi:CHAD domain-containing protein
VAFRLDPAAGLPRQVLALLDEEVATARRAARGGGTAAVHAIRQHGKRSRALLRLVRPTLSGKRFTRINHAWRDVGRMLSAVRDRTAIADCLEALHKRYPEDIGAGAVVELRIHLPLIGPAHMGRVIGQAHRALTTLRHHLRDLRWRGGWSKAIKGHRDALEACHAARRRALVRQDAAERHEWRKRVKDVRYQTHLLGDLCPGVLGQLEDAWDRLGTALGRENDLVMTCAWLASLRGPPSAAVLLRAGQRWLRHLRRRSNRLAREIAVEPRLLSVALGRARAERRG